MRHALTLALATFLLASCGRAERTVAAFEPPAPIETKVIQERARTIAYEHSVEVTVPSETIPTAFTSVRQKCTELQERCQLLDSRIQNGSTPSATLKLRVAPVSISNIIESIGMVGEVTSQSTSADDLGTLIADSKKTLALKVDYRTRLESLLQKASGDIDSLIKINKELAQVQAELEEAESHDAFLAKRVNTELLNISMSSPQVQSAWGHLSDTPGAIARNLASGAAAMIATVSFCIPWLLLLLSLIVVYKFARRFKRPRTGA